VVGDLSGAWEIRARFPGRKGWQVLVCGFLNIAVLPDRPPNAPRQARPMAGARDERRLLGVACTRLLGCHRSNRAISGGILTS
jgi:hypothetical protein